MLRMLRVAEKPRIQPTPISGNMARAMCNGVGIVRVVKTPLHTEYHLYRGAIIRRFKATGKWELDPNDYQGRIQDIRRDLRSHG
jgi:hypothetical protein